jgi:hypothetical protein
MPHFARLSLGRAGGQVFRNGIRLRRPHDLGACPPYVEACLS